MAVALGLAISFALDLYREWPDWWRWGVWLIGVALPGAGLAASLASRIRRAPSWLDLAAMAERANPQLGERLMGAVGLLLDRSHDSNFLARRLVRQAALDAETLDLDRIAPWDRSRRRGLAGALALLLAIIPALWRPDPFATALRRAAAPWSQVERAGLWRIDATDGDLVVLAGDPIVIRAVMRSAIPSIFGNGPDSAALWRRDASGSGDVQRIPSRSRSGTNADAEAAADGHKEFEFLVPALTRSVEFGIESGWARSRSYRAEVVEAPGVVEWRAIVEPPPYARGIAESHERPSKITVPEGARVIMTGLANRPLRLARAERGAGDQATLFEGTVRDGGDPKAWRIAFVPRAIDDYRIIAEDDHGWPLRESPRVRIAIRPDSAPAIELDGPQDGEAIRPDDVLQADLRIRDDFAIASADLIIQPLRGQVQDEETRIPLVSLQGMMSREASGEAALSLRRLGLKSGDMLIYRIQAADNRDLGQGPNVSRTEARTLRIDDRAEPSRRRSSEDRERWKARLAELRRRSLANRQETEPLRYAADAARGQPSAWAEPQSQALLERRAEAQGVADALTAFAREIHQSPFYAPLAVDAQDASATVAEPIAQNMTRARQSSDPFARLDLLKQADAGFSDLAKRLEEMEARLDRLAKLAEERQRIRRLAERQEDLARSLTDQDRGAAEVRDEQSRIEREAADLEAGDRPQVQTARAAMDRARRLLDGPTPQAGPASQAMREAANGLKTAGAERNGDGAKAMANAGASAGESGGGEQNASSSLGSASALRSDPASRMRSNRRWGELPGHLRAEASRMSQTPFREEYASSIRRYYRALAETPEQPARP